MLHERSLERAQRLAIYIRKSLESHLRAIGCVEHPLRNFDQHRMRGRFRELAQVRPLRVRAACFARRNGEPKPTVPRISNFPRIKSDFVGFLSWVCIALPIVGKNTNGLGAAVAKDEQAAGKRIAAQLLAAQLRQRVDTLSSVAG